MAQILVLGFSTMRSRTKIRPQKIWILQGKTHPVYVCNEILEHSHIMINNFSCQLDDAFVQTKPKYIIPNTKLNFILVLLISRQFI